MERIIDASLGPAGKIAALISEPTPAMFSGLVGLLIVTLFVGSSHAMDPEEPTEIRVTGAVLVAVSIATLAIGIYAVLQR